MPVKTPPKRPETMVTLTPKGLYCRAGDFYIDPRAAVERAVITHAHSDHARRGSRRYFSTVSGEGLLRARLGRNIEVVALEYGKQFQLGSVSVSFHPAGHILGSAQVRIEQGGEVWVASGDYKRDPDPTCEEFEVVKCDTFITEATFGTPSYVWNKKADLGHEIHEWWMENARHGRNCLLFAYSLGKTQRVLGLLERYARKAILCHSSAAEINRCYRDQGIRLAQTRCLSEILDREPLRGELFLAPHAFLKSAQAALLGDSYVTAFASGWMARDTGRYDRGFLLSDHADWNDLVQTTRETGAQTVYVQHRGHGALVRNLNRLGIRAFPESALQYRPGAQMELF